jgi:murein DD-endopeptidase MepM/ murein hydrolase activator NlpD
MAFVSVTAAPEFLERVREHGFPTSNPVARAVAKLRGMTRFAVLSAIISGVFLIGAPAHAAEKAAVGGPFEAVTNAKSANKSDPQFRALFNSWKRLDTQSQGFVAIPSAKPVSLSIALSSGFGVRSDPFRGGAAMHSGVDIPGPVGTPIYATADGVVGRTGWVGGYGNLVELEHGKGIQTRYGHLSSIIAQPGTRVKRGQLIGLMGSTGRSTGSHLHYEVRLEGRAVNPTPFLRTDGYLLAMERRASGNVALGGPAKAD